MVFFLQQFQKTIRQNYMLFLRIYHIFFLKIDKTFHKIQKKIILKILKTTTENSKIYSLIKMKLFNQLYFWIVNNIKDIIVNKIIRGDVRYKIGDGRLNFFFFLSSPPTSWITIRYLHDNTFSTSVISSSYTHPSVLTKYLDHLVCIFPKRDNSTNGRK